MLHFREMHSKAITVMIMAGMVSATVIVPVTIRAQTQDAPEKIYKVGQGVTAPRAIYQPSPDFSEEARKAAYQGTCVLKLIVGVDGLPRDIRVTLSIGMGLDEKAVEAVRKWRFSPALKDGEPVPVEIAVEVDFHLYQKSDQRIAELTRAAHAGDAGAQLDLANAYFEGKEVGKNEALGMTYLSKAANQGLPRAQFEMGEHLAHDASPEYAKAYMWYTIADRNGDKHSRKALKKLTAQMTPDQEQAGRAMADAWKPGAAK
jgi:TonB family protein